MNYIYLINEAWELREQGLLSPQEHDLYYYLLHKSNRLNWKNPFNQPTDVICAILGTNRNSFSARRRRLQELGLIRFRQGKARNRPAEYSIVYNSPDEPSLSTIKPKGIKNTVKTDKRREKPKGTFIVPFQEDVVKYCSLRKNDVDAQLFFDFYQSKNWMIGRNKMKDWKAAVRTWEKNNKGTKHNTANHDNNKTFEKF